MKIKTRNIIFSCLMFISLLTLVGYGIFFGIKLYTTGISLPSNIPESYPRGFFLTECNIYAIVASIFLLLIYDFAFLVFINVEFEKTQSTEIIYFVMFLFAVFMEHHRLITPFLNLWENANALEIFVTNTLILGRTVAPLSLLFSVIYSNSESRQYTEQTLIGIIVFSLFIAKLVPVNTNLVLPIGALRIGFGKMIYFMLMIVFIVAIISQLIKKILTHSNSKLFVSFIFLIIGYFIMIQSYSILTTILGTVPLFVGTYNYLRALHSQYLWN